MIELCEDLSDSRAAVTTIPTWLLKRVRGLLQSLQWAKDAADRLVRALLITMHYANACIIMHMPINACKWVEVWVLSRGGFVCVCPFLLLHTQVDGRKCTVLLLVGSGQHICAVCCDQRQ